MSALQTVRGNCWINPPERMCSSERPFGSVPNSESALKGFRIAKHKDRSRTLRGGAYYAGPWTYRTRDKSHIRGSYLGFRVSRRKP